MVVPKLSQAYMKIFYAKQCKDRLVELHSWLVGVIENTQTFFQQRAAAAVANQLDEFMQHMDTTEAMPAVWLCAFLFAGANTPFPHYFRGLPPFAFALEEVNIQLTKAPIFPSKLRSSIETNAGLGLRLTPSADQQGKYFGATVGGFLRDVADLDPTLTKVQIGAKLVRINGVDVADEAFDKVLSHLRSVGLPLRLRFLYNPHLHRRQRGKSMHWRESEGSIDGSPRQARDRGLSSVSTAQELSIRSRSSVASTSSMSSPFVKAPVSGSAGGKDAHQRRYSVDSRKSIGIFSSVFGDLFGRKRNETADVLFNNQIEELFSWDDIGGEIRDITSRGFFSFLSQSLLRELRQKERLKYDESELLEQPGSASSASDQLLKTLNERKGQGIWSTSTGALGFSFGACKLRDIEAAMLEIPPVVSLHAFFFWLGWHPFLGNGLIVDVCIVFAELDSSSHHVLAVWEGNHCSVLMCGRHRLVGGRRSYLTARGFFFLYFLSEKHLGKGFVLVSINNESTFGMKFSAVMKMLTKASRPTSVCFRWFKGT